MMTAADGKVLNEEVGERDIVRRTPWVLKALAVHGEGQGTMEVTELYNAGAAGRRFCWCRTTISAYIFCIVDGVSVSRVALKG